MSLVYSFFQSIGTLDLNDKYIYYYRNFDDYGSKIFLKQDKKYMMNC